jgi:hypothetical protein
VTDELIEKVAKYALSKTGAKLGRNGVELPGLEWGDFIEVKLGRRCARMPVMEENLKRHCTNHPAIHKTYFYLDRDLPANWEHLLWHDAPCRGFTMRSIVPHLRGDVLRLDRATLNCVR